MAPVCARKLLAACIVKDIGVMATVHIGRTCCCSSIIHISINVVYYLALVQHKSYKSASNCVYVGPMVWYQKFDYAIGHWMQKATEHVIGCVLCSPGCFSLFRGEALMDDAVMKKYTTVSNEARHYVQYDQGKTIQHLSSPYLFTKVS
jgi:hypothetical protein